MEKKYKGKDLGELRDQLVSLIQDKLSPLARKYGYSELPLEGRIRWKPLVLFLGNYSSGKSTLINELIGNRVQETGQAPTDDSFTVITGESVQDPKVPEGSVVEERSGKVLISESQYPFAEMGRHGERFAAHFRLKKVNCAWLEDLAIIDSPGMLDSVSERDRGYNYQEVLGDLVRLADVVFVFFDPHKAGTIKESHASLRETLPQNTFEDRIVFVLNRIDECTTMEDLLRVYGTLCWNLSQMLGRKDIPRILLTYAPTVAVGEQRKNPANFLYHLENQRQELKRIISRAPLQRLDNLADFIDFHATRLAHFVECLIAYTRKRMIFALKMGVLGFISSFLVSFLLGSYVHVVQPFGPLNIEQVSLAAAILGLLLYALWHALAMKALVPMYLTKIYNQLDTLTALDSQKRIDSWDSIADLLRSYVKAQAVGVSRSSLKREWKLLKAIQLHELQNLRDAITQVSKHHTP